MSRAYETYIIRGNDCARIKAHKIWVRQRTHSTRGDRFADHQLLISVTYQRDADEMLAYIHPVHNKKRVLFTYAHMYVYIK